MTATISHTRLRVLFAFFTVASLLLSARLAYWQTIGRADLLSRATDQVHSDLVVAAQRGVIRDRSGAILATTVELRSLYAIPSQMKDAEGNDTRSAVAAALAPILGERPEVLRAAFDSGAEWLFIRRRLPEETASKIAALALGLRTAVAAKNGDDLWLTVDLAVQTAAERELAAVVEREKATGGAIVILDPRDGAVLAMASSPTYDPAHVV